MTISLIASVIFTQCHLSLAIAESGKGSDLSRDFFREEYLLNAKIGNLGVPIVSLIQGICMGGVSVIGNCRHHLINICSH